MTTHGISRWTSATLAVALMIAPAAYAHRTAYKQVRPRVKALHGLKQLVKKTGLKKAFPKAKISLAKDPRVSHAQDPLAWHVLIDGKPSHLFMVTSSVNDQATLHVFKKPKFEEQITRLSRKGKAYRLNTREARKAFRRSVAKQIYTLADVARGLK